MATEETVELQQQMNIVGADDTDSPTSAHPFEMETILKTTKIHSRRRRRCTYLRYIILAVVGIAYLVYGIIKLQDAESKPLTRSHVESISTYSSPIIVAKNDHFFGHPRYFNISWIEVDGNDQPLTFFEAGSTDINHTESLNGISFYNIPDFGKKWVIIHYELGSDPLFGTYFVLSDYYLILPPSNSTFIESVNIQYSYWHNNYLDVAEDLYDLGFDIPDFMSSTGKYQIEHGIVNTKEYYDNIDEYEITNIIQQIELALLTLATPTYYANPFSSSSYEIKLITTKYVDGSVTNEYNSIFQGSASRFTLLHEFCLNNYIEQHKNISVICSKIQITYKPQHIGNDDQLYHEIHEEYISYKLPDLWAGIGGVVSGADKLIVAILSFLFVGISIHKFGINRSVDGYAPHPRFNKEFEERLRRFIATDQSIQQYIKHQISNQGNI